jgi:hypothetical protein
MNNLATATALTLMTALTAGLPQGGARPAVPQVSKSAAAAAVSAAAAGRIAQLRDGLTAVLLLAIAATLALLMPPTPAPGDVLTLKLSLAGGLLFTALAARRAYQLSAGRDTSGASS